MMQASSISDSYATGVVSGDSYVGGLVGLNISAGHATDISGSYAAVSVSGAGTLGGLVGSSSGTVTGSYYDSDVCGASAINAVGTAKTTAQMMNQATYSGWNFAGSWSIIENESYPYLTAGFPNGAHAVSGRAYQNAGITALSGAEVDLIVNGESVDTSLTMNNGFYYMITDAPRISEDDAVLVYVDDHATYEGNTVTIASTAGITGLDIYGGDTVIARHETADPVTNATFDAAKGSLTDNDILYSVSTSDLSLSSGAGLTVWAGDTYTPGGDLSAADLSIQTGATYNAADSAITVGGSWTNAGTFNAGTSAVTFNGTSVQTITSGGSSFTDVVFNNASGTWTLQDAFTATDDLTVSAGELDTGSDMAINVTDDLTISTGGSIDAQSSTITVGGDWDVQDGTFYSDTSTVNLTGTGIVRTDTYYERAAFYNLSCATSGNTSSMTTGNHVRISGQLTLNGGTLDASNKAFALDTAGAYAGSEMIASTDPNSTITGTSLLAFRPTASGTYYLGDDVNYDMAVYLSSSQNNVTYALNADLAAKSITFETGGSGQVFTTTSNNYDITLTGDLRAGGYGFQNHDNGLSIYFNDSDIVVEDIRAGDLYNTNVTDNFYLGSSRITVNGDWDNHYDDGTYVNTFNIDAGTSTVTFVSDDNSDYIQSNGESFHNVVFNDASATWTLSDAFDANGNVSIAAGTLNANGQNINIGGSWTNADTFTHNDNTVTFDASSSGKTITTGGDAFYGLAFNGAGGWQLQDVVTVDDDLSLSAGTLDTNSKTVNVTGTMTQDGGNISTAGNVTLTTGNYNRSSGTIASTGGNVAITGTDVTAGGIAVSGASKTLNLTSTSDMVINDDLSTTSGIMTLTTQNTGTFTQSSGTLSSTSGNIYIMNSFFTAGAGNDFVVGDVNSGGVFQVYYVPNSITLNGDISANGNIFMDYSAGGLTVNGDITAAGSSIRLSSGGPMGRPPGAFIQNSGAITGTGADTYVSITSATSLTANDISSASSYVNLTSSGDITLNSDISAGSYVSINSSAGTIDQNAGTVTSGGSSDVTFDAAGSSNVSGITSANDIFFRQNGGSASYDLGTATIDAVGDITIDSGVTVNASTSDIYTGGSWINSGTFNDDTSSVTFDGAGSNTITTGGDEFYNLVFNGAGDWTLQDDLVQNSAVTTAFTNGTLDLNGNMFNNTKYQTVTLGNGFTLDIGSGYTATNGNMSIVVGDGAQVDISSGILDANYFTVSGTGTFNAGAGTIRAAGNVAITSANWDAGTSLLYQDYGTKTINATQSLYNYRVGGSSNYNVDVTLLNDLTVENDLSIIAGSGGTRSLSTDTYDMNVGGSWTNAGTFNAGSGSVTFNSINTGETITSGGDSFNDVIFDSADASGAWSLSDALAASTVTVTDGKLTDNGQTVTVGGNIDVANTTGILSSTGTWVQSADGNISNPYFHNNKFNVLQIADGVTSTRTGTVHAQKLILGDNAALEGSGSFRVAYSSYLTDPIDMGSGASISDGSVSFYLNDNQTYTQKAWASSGSVSFNYANNATVQMTGDWQTGSLTIFGTTQSDTEAEAMTLDTNGNDLTVNGNLRLGSDHPSYPDDYYAKILFDSGTHNISGNMYVNATSPTQHSHGYFDLGSSDIYIGGNVDFSYATVTAGTSTVTFNGTSKQTITPGGQSFNDLVLDTNAALNYDNLELLGSGSTLDILGDLTITNGGFEINSNSTLNVGGDVTIGSGTTGIDADDGNIAINVGGNWSNGGTGGVGGGGPSDGFDESGSTVTFNGSSAQSIGSTIFYDLVIANTHASDEVDISSGTVSVSNTLDVNDGIFSVGSGKTLDVNYNGLNAVDIANGATLEVDGGTVTVDGGNYGQIDVASGGVLDIRSGTVTSLGSMMLDGKLKMSDGILTLGNTTDNLDSVDILHIGASGGSEAGDVTGGAIYLDSIYSSGDYILGVDDGGKFLPTVTTSDTGNLVVMRTASGQSGYIRNESSAPNYSNVVFNRLQIGDAVKTGSLIQNSGSNTASLNVYNKLTIYDGSTLDHTWEGGDDMVIYADKFVNDGTYTKSQK